MFKLLRILLYPFSFLYGVAVFFRNRLYNLKVFKSVEFHVPVISVGNITVGGTGKTPHTEYLIRLLQDRFKVALLSRGYKRKTHGFVLASRESTAEIIGDEPFQVKRKFPDLTVAVDRNRVEGIHRIIKNVPETDIVILDDAYQHRSVNPGVSILLIDYNKPLYKDTLLPLGLLREQASEKKRADIIIVTKVPASISAMDKRLFAMHTGVQPHQSIYFTTVKYGNPVPVFDPVGENTAVDFSNEELHVLLVTGIADPAPLRYKLKELYNTVIPVRFADHHSFTANDLKNIVEKFNQIPSDNKIILTTEKDMVRLLPFDSEEFQPRAWFYIPIEIAFLSNEAEQFEHQILHYVNNNSKDSILYKKQN